MIYITGDTHGVNDFFKLLSTKLSKLTKEDYLIITGDCGVLFDVVQSPSIINLYSYLPYTVLFVDGNHENFNLLNSIPVSVWNGGKVHKISNSIYHLMRGQIYTIEGKKIFTFGGALSFDKERRKEGLNWWKEEMPTEEEYQEALINLKKNNYTIDYVISHDCPTSWIGGSKGSSKLMYEGYLLSDSNYYLEKIAERIMFRQWFFGHYHVDVCLSPIATELFHKIINLEDYHALPLLRGCDYLNEQSLWNKPMKYSGKLISILGDSISTFEGYNPNGYRVHYAHQIKEITGVMNVNDTWWMQVIHSLDGKLCSNNSYSGSLVTGFSKSSGCNLQRIKHLSYENLIPNVILVYIGTNDFGSNVSINSPIWFNSFLVCFKKMIKRLRKLYPQSEIWVSGISSTPRIVRLKKESGVQLSDYNKCIEKISIDMNAHYIHGIIIEEYETHDGLHPNRQGMRKIAMHWINNMLQV